MSINGEIYEWGGIDGGNGLKEIIDIRLGMLIGRIVILLMICVGDILKGGLDEI